MAWIELHDNLPDHPKTIASSAALKLDKDAMVGKLSRLWTWAANEREDGFVSDTEIQTVAEIMRWTKRPQLLMDGLCTIPPRGTAGFLERVDGGYMIHGWDERIGMLKAKREETRARTRERVARYRASQKDESVTQCNALHERCETRTVTQCNAATVPNRTKEEEEGETACAREDGPRADLVAHCQANFPAMNAAAYDELRSFMDDGITADMVILAVDEARAHGSIAWSYARSIMDNWVMAGIKTTEAAKASIAQHRARGKPIPGRPPDEPPPMRPGLKFCD